MHSLNDLERVHLLLAVQSTIKEETLHQLDTEYVNDMLKLVKQQPTHASLTRGQIASAVAYQRMLQRYSSFSHKPPNWKQLTGVAVAAGLPFLGFGLVDNLVMLVAGEGIDAAFGVRLGMTTLASAGLGNMVADVIGVTATQQIKELSRRTTWAQPPRLSTLQQSMNRVRVAKMLGAASFVSIGCLIGMVPLAFMPPGFTTDRSAELAELEHKKELAAAGVGQH